MCHTANGPSTCTLDVEHTRLGERSGYYATPNNGDLRWMIWGTCYSVDTLPGEQWGQTLARGPDAVMGYRGLSADSSYTDEVAEDFAEEAWGANDTIKASWFYAVEDWWIDDVGSLIVPSRVVGGTGADAMSARDNLKRTWARRAATQDAAFLASAFHSG